MKKNKILLTVLIVMIMFLMQMSLIITETRAETITGTDASVSWNFDTETGELIFSGTGNVGEAWKNSVQPKNVISLKINEGITGIGLFDLSLCSSIKTITVPSTVVSINTTGLFNLSTLQSISVDEGNSQYSSVDGILFNKDKTKIEVYPASKTGDTYIIPNEVTSIGDYAFKMCLNLQNITISRSVSNIGKYAFELCSTKNIKVDEQNINYSSIDGVLFSKDETKIMVYPSGKTETTYTIPNSVTEIYENAFSYARNLENVVIPSSVTKIGTSAFLECDALTKVTIPSGIQTIERSSFENCDNLTEMIIPNTVTSIEENAFCQDKNLKKIVIPNSVTNINEYAFFINDNVTIYCKSNSTAKTYSIENQIDYIIDDTAPTIISAEENGSQIVIKASDEGVGLHSTPYSIDGTNWSSESNIIVEPNKEYTIYVRDELENVSTKKVTTSSNVLDDQNTQIDDTKATSNLPQTGGTSILILIFIAIVVAIIARRKLKNTGF